MLLVAVGTSACEDPDISIEITDTRASRTPDREVAVEVDLEAHERLGKNLGTYCVRVTFASEDPKIIHEDCKADLEDGDTKTMRFVSTNKDIVVGTNIHVRVRLAGTDTGSDIAAPN